MTYHLIGTGNTAWFLAKKLSAAGHICRGIYGRNTDSAAELAREIDSRVLIHLSDIADDADCCIIAITDSAIADVAGQLSFQHTTLVHTAGSIEKKVLENAARNTGIVWPIYSIIKTDIPSHRNIPCVWEASPGTATSVVTELIKSFSDTTYHADSQQRKWLHLTAVFSNNFTNHLLAICDDICTKHNLPLSLLLPILNQTIERISTHKPAEVQTGPAKRGDHNIINKHLEMLSGNTNWQEIYRTLSASIENMYKAGKK